MSFYLLIHKWTCTLAYMCRSRRTCRIWLSPPSTCTWGLNSGTFAHWAISPGYGNYVLNDIKILYQSKPFSDSARTSWFSGILDFLWNIWTKQSLTKFLWIHGLAGRPATIQGYFFWQSLSLKRGWRGSSAVKSPCEFSRGPGVQFPTST